MNGIRQLEEYAEQLTTSVKILARHCHGENSLGQLLAAPDTPKDVTEARASILASAGGIKTLIGSPVDFLQHLASQVRTPYPSWPNRHPPPPHRSPAPR